MAGGDTSSSGPPSRPGRSPVLLILAALAVVILIGLNVMSAQFRPKSDEELQKEAQDKAAAQASPSPSPSPSAGSGGGQGLVFLSPNGTLGDPKTPKEIVVAFAWTPQVQGDPAKVYDAVTALQKTLPPMAHIRVVDVDLDPSVPEGISVGGRVLVAAAPDGGIALPGPAIGHLMGALMAPGGPPGAPPAGAPAAPGPPPAK